MSLELLNVDIEQNHPFKGLRASQGYKNGGAAAVSILQLQAALM